MSGKLRASEWLTLAGAAVLLLSTFFYWFSLPGINELQRLAPNVRLQGDGSLDPISLNVWDLGVARWFVYLAIGLAFCMILAALLSPSPDWAVILATPLVFTSGIALLCVVFRLIDSPRPYAESTGWFYVAVAGAAVLFAGACWAIRDESVPEGFVKAPRPDFVEVGD